MHHHRTRPDHLIPSVTNDSTGLYHADYLTTQPGLHTITWSTTVPGTAAADVFNVRQFAAIISLAEAKAHLDITSTADDDELRNFLDVRHRARRIQSRAVRRRTYTDRVHEGPWQLVLNRRPVISVQSVTSTWATGPTWTTAQLKVDTEAGIVELLYPWPFMWGPWDVTFTAGRAIIPERFLQAAKEQLRHLWETQRGSAQAPPLAGEEQFTASMGMSFTVPRRVIELLADDIVPAA